MTRIEKLSAMFKIYNLIDEARDTAAAHDLAAIADAAARLMEMIAATGNALFNAKEARTDAEN